MEPVVVKPRCGFRNSCRGQEKIVADLVRISGASCFLPIQVQELLDAMILKGPSIFTVVALKVTSPLADL